MKLEKVNDNQIRCIISREDLEDRQIKLSELAYGTSKAKMLLKDVMQQASYELGFEAENIPLMIEAIPMNTGCVVFIITKVQNPEELDTRFSRFAPSVMDENEENSDDYDDYDTDDEFDEPEPNNHPQIQGTARIEIVGGEALQNLIENLGTEAGMNDLFNKILSSANLHKNAKAPTGSNNDESDPKFSKVRVFVFDDLESVGKACRILVNVFDGKSWLYKNPDDGKFYLKLVRTDEDKKDFLKICNLMIEYSSHLKFTDAAIAYMEEHYKCLVAEHAVSSMCQF